LGSTVPQRHERYRGLVLVLALGVVVAATLAGVAGGTVAQAFFPAAGVLALAAGMLAGTALAQALRSGIAAAKPVSPALLRLGAAAAGALAALGPTVGEVPVPAAGLVRGVAVGGAVGLVGALSVARTLEALAREGELPEAAGLAEWARATAWSLVVALVATGAVAAGWPRVASALALGGTLAVLILAVEVGLDQGPRGELTVWRSGSRILDVLATRLDPVGSLFDVLGASFGIDVRSTWALQVVRRSVEPLLAGLALAAWSSTALTVVLPSEVGLSERFGVAASGPPLEPGLHVHLPWPVDVVQRIPVRAARTVPIGHEEEAQTGPEDVLWARQHAASEYTLVLGNGRDLVTIDAAVHYRITDAARWRYSCQNPEDALRAVAYRAVMDRTVDRTLSDVLSENVGVVTGQLAADVQAQADALGLGVQVLGFTVGGMHPPVPVARSYQAVVSAQIQRQTAVVDAEAYANKVLPAASSAVTVATNRARADAARARQSAAGESAGFRTLEAAYKADPGEFRFRRRLEVLEQTLPAERVTVLDTRLERDGAELWLTE
jgi:regulator of protease activity HflC (stomatin/prohibitin superfamily)